MRAAIVVAALAALAPGAQAAVMKCVAPTLAEPYQAQGTLAAGTLAGGATLSNAVTCNTGWTQSGGAVSWTCPSVQDNVANAAGVTGVRPDATGSLPTCQEFRIRGSFEVTVEGGFAHKLQVTSNDQYTKFEAAVKGVLKANFIDTGTSSLALSTVVVKSVDLEARRRLEARRLQTTNRIKVNYVINCADKAKCDKVAASVTTVVATAASKSAFSGALIDAINYAEFTSSRATEPIAVNGAAASDQDAASSTARGLRVTEVSDSTKISSAIYNSGEVIVKLSSSTATSSTKPGPVDGATVYFKAIKTTTVGSTPKGSATIHWSAPYQGDYAAATLGYKIQYREVCAVAVNHADQQVLAYEALSGQVGVYLKGSSGNWPTGATTKIYNTLSDSKAITAVKDLYNVGACSSGVNTWTDVTGVYTPYLGQNHDLTCNSYCKTQTCSLFGDDAAIIAACSGCYPKDKTTAGCFPGSTGFPTAPLTQHTITGLTINKLYVFKIAAWNHFGTSAYGTQSYALKTHNVPNAPLAPTTLTDPGSTTDTITWKMPENFQVGTDECSAAISIVNYANSRCTTSAVSSQVEACDSDGDGQLSAAEATACACDTDSDKLVDPQPCSTNGYGAATPITSYEVWAKKSGGASAKVATVSATTTIVAANKHTKTYCTANSVSAANWATQTAACKAAGSAACSGVYGACDASSGTFVQCDATKPFTSDTKTIAGLCVFNYVPVTYSATGLTAGATYQWQIKAVSGAGTSALGALGSVVTMDSVPAAPSLAPLATTVTDTTAALSWDLAVAQSTINGAKISGSKLYAQSLRCVGGHQLMTSCTKSTVGSTTVDCLNTAFGTAGVCTWDTARRSASSDGKDTLGSKTDYAYRDRQGATVTLSLGRTGAPYTTVATGKTSHADCTQISTANTIASVAACQASCDALAACNAITYLSNGAKTCRTLTCPAIADNQAAYKLPAYDYKLGSATANTNFYSREVNYALLMTQLTSQATCASTAKTTGSPKCTATLSSLAPDTAYRFKQRLTNAVGDSADGPWSTTYITTETAVSNLRIYSGPPCVSKMASTTTTLASGGADTGMKRGSLTTFAATSLGTNVEYRWEVIYNNAAGVNGQATYGSNTGRVLGATIGKPGAIAASGKAGCKNRQCSVLEWAIPLPGVDKDTPNYDEIAIGVVAYNSRGISRAVTVYGWELDQSGAVTFTEVTAAQNKAADYTVCPKTPAETASATGVTASAAACGLKCAEDKDCTHYTWVTTGTKTCIKQQCPINGLGQTGTSTTPYRHAYSSTAAANTKHYARAIDHNYQTIEYCGCTDPTDEAYWELATYHRPDMCKAFAAGAAAPKSQETWGVSLTDTKPNVVKKGEFEYFQMQFEQETHEVEVVLRVYSGTVDVYFGVDGVANPGMTSTYASQLTRTGVTNFYVARVPYDVLSSCASKPCRQLYITVQGQETAIVGSNPKMPWATFNVIGHQSQFKNSKGVTLTASRSGDRAVLSDNTAATEADLDTHYYQFYEYHYPKADNDLDVELRLTNVAGSVDVFASKTNRYPSPERFVPSLTSDTFSPSALHGAKFSLCPEVRALSGTPVAGTLGATTSANVADCQAKCKAQPLCNMFSFGNSKCVLHGCDYKGAGYLTDWKLASTAQSTKGIFRAATSKINGVGGLGHSGWNAYERLYVDAGYIQNSLVGTTPTVQHSTTVCSKDSGGKCSIATGNTKGSVTLTYTIAPEDRTAGIKGNDGVLYFGVRGGYVGSSASAASGANPAFGGFHAPGTSLTRSSYTITAQAFRYTIQSDLMEPATLGGAKTEDRRYSVVTKANYNYYEVKLSPAAYKVTVTIVLHYGQIDLYWSKNGLPTQDLSSCCEDTQGGKVSYTEAGTYTQEINYGHFMQSGMAEAGKKFYTYLGLLGKVPDSSYDIKVAETAFSTSSTPTNLYMCKSSAVGVSQAATNDLSKVWKYTAVCSASGSCKLGTCTGTCSGGSTVALDAACSILPGCTKAVDAASSPCTTTTITAASHFYQVYVGTPDVAMEIAARSGAGSRTSRTPTYAGTTTDTSVGTAASASWGLDWNEAMTATWIKDHKDEQDMDVKISLPAKNNLAMWVSTREKFTSDERGYDVKAAANAAITSAPVYTFQNQMVYIQLKASSAITVNGGAAGHIQLTKADVTTGRGKTAATTVSAKQTCTDRCNDHGTCIYDPLDTAHCKGALTGGSCSAYCVCDYGFYGTSCEYAALSAQTSATSPSGVGTMRKPVVTGALVGVTSGKAEDMKDYKYMTVSTDANVGTLYTKATEQVTLDCSRDDCKTSAVSGVPSASCGTGDIGCVICTSGPVVCKKTVAAPMATVTVSVDDFPSNAKVQVYVDGKPYPRAGHNVIHYPTGSNSADATKSVKLYKLATRVTHTVVLVLTTDKGDILGMDRDQFNVQHMNGCQKDASGNECGGKGVCHEGYCVCFDGYYGLTCSSTFTETADLASPKTCIHAGTKEPLALDCTSTACASGGGTCVDFHAAAQYRIKHDAALQDGISSSRFIASMERSENAAAIAKSDAALSTKKTAIHTSLVTASTNTANSVKTAKAATATNVANLKAAKERNAVIIQQARLESVRLATANKEQWIDSKRSLYAHQTAMQNRLDKDYHAMKTKNAAWATAINAQHTQGRFIKNQLRTANGPRTKIADLKTESCTTDQFFRTTCTKTDASSSFTTSASTSSYTSIPR